jgi:hypothetical protein
MKLSLDASAFKEVERKVAALRREVAGKALGIGLSKAAKVGQTAAKREVASEYNVKSAEVGKRLSVRLDRAGREPRAILSAKYSRTARLPVIAFGAVDSKRRGVAFRIRKGGKRERLNHAFVATMPSGHTGVYMRVKGARKVKEVMTTDIATMFAGKRVAPRVQQRVLEVLPRTILHELNRAAKNVGWK